MPITGGGPGGKLSDMVWVTKFTLAIGARLIIPAGRVVRALWCDHAQFIHANIETMVDADWKVSENINGDDLEPAGQDMVAYLNTPIWSDGASVCIHNTSGALLTEISYGYNS